MPTSTTPDLPSSPAPEPTPAPSGPGVAFKVAAVGLVVLAAVAGTGLARWFGDPPAKELPPPPVKLQLNGWPKPDLALFLTAQMHGYLLPCGCSRPQVGGLERRYNLFSLLKEKGWTVVPLDLGDVPQKEGPAKLPNLQGLIKYKYSMLALNKMQYAATGMGEYEAALPTLNGIGEILNEKVPPILLGNLDDKQGLRQGLEGHLEPGRLLEDRISKLKIAVASAVGPVAAAKITDPNIKLLDADKALADLAPKLTALKPDYQVLLYHGSLTMGRKRNSPDSDAVEVAKAFPQFDVVLCLTEEDEPPANPTVVKHKNGRETLVLGIGQKGKYVGVLGLYRKGSGIESKWELVNMSEAFLTPEEKEKDHPIVNLLEKYTQELKDKNYLAKAPEIKHPSQLAIPGANPKYVGENPKESACAKCHPLAHQVWANSAHSHAYKTLVNAKRPSNREFDPECIVCHTVGYGYDSGFRDANKTPLLRDVGCESCHGPCSEHVAAPKNAAWYPIINPFRPQKGETPEQKTKRLAQIDQFCQKCHDIDNDVNWGTVGFAKKWQLIEH